jgi:sec-independent protein translocase protein TatB
MFEVGFSEMLVIAVVALLVLGPEKLPNAARFAGLWIRRARAQWYSVKAELEREIAAEQLRSQFKDGVDELRDEMRPIGDNTSRGRDADGHEPPPPTGAVAKDDHFAP